MGTDLSDRSLPRCPHRAGRGGRLATAGELPGPVGARIAACLRKLGWPGHAQAPEVLRQRADQKALNTVTASATHPAADAQMAAFMAAAMSALGSSPASTDDERQV